MDSPGYHPVGNQGWSESMPLCNQWRPHPNFGMTPTRVGKGRNDRRTMREAMSRAYEPFAPSKSTPAQLTYVIGCKQCGQKNRVKRGSTSRSGRCSADVSR